MFERLQGKWLSVPALLVTAVLLGSGAYVVKGQLGGDCCKPGASCCKPGAACCTLGGAHGAH